MDRLHDIVMARLVRPAPAEVTRLCEEMGRRYGDALSAVVFYGSCLRQGDAIEGVVDLYVIVSRYGAVFSRWRSRMLAGFLPPTVGYLEMDSEQGPIRAKYAVISEDDFRRGTSRWFHSYLWGRFAQPCVLGYARDDTTRHAVAESMVTAARKLIGKTLPLAPTPVQAVDLWAAALECSYRTELRPESPGRARDIVAADRSYFGDLTAVLAEGSDEIELTETPGTGHKLYALRTTRRRRLQARLAWRVRRVTGKLMSTARWFKALATFEGGLDYAVWKLERHSGVKITLPERVRRRPWLYVWGELIRLYRSGVLR